MMKTIYTCDFCTKQIEGDYICFCGDNTKHFYSVDLRVSTAGDVFAKNILADLTLLCFCSKECLINYLHDNIKEI